MKRREYSIALLVLAGAVLLVFGVNYLKGLDLLQKRNVYHVVYGNVAGIGESTPVFYNGYKVGQVVRTSFLPGSGRIAVSFQLSEQELKLPADSRVEIYSADLFTRALQLLPGVSNTMATPGDTLMGSAQLSITDAVGEQIDPLKRKAEGMLASVDSVLTALQLILNDSARRDIDASFSSIRSTLETFNQSAQRIDAMIAAERETIHNTLGHIEAITANFRAYNDEIGRIVANLDSISSTLAHGGLDQVMADLTSASGQLKTLMDRMERGEGTLGALLHNDTLYQNLQSASRELDLLMEDLRLNPNRYVHLSLFGRKDRLPKLSDSDVDRIKRALQEDKRMQR